MNQSAVFLPAAMAMLLMPLTAAALTPDEATYSRERGSGIVTSIENARRVQMAIPQAFAPSEPAAVAREFLKRHAGALGTAASGDELQFQETVTDELGMSRVRFMQKINGVPVYDGQYTVHLDGAMGVLRASGRLAPALKVDTNPKLSREEAVSRAKEIWASSHGSGGKLEGRADLFVLSRAIVGHKKDDRNHLVWRVTLSGLNPPVLEYLFIDAHNGELRRQVTGLRKAMDRRVVDCMLAGDCSEAYFAYSYPTLASCPYLDAAYIRMEGSSSYGNTDVDELYANLGHVDGYYESLGLNGANGQGGLEDGVCFLPSVTAAYARIETSFPGLCPNAFSIGPAIFFCSGGFTELSIVAHEYTHSVNYYGITDGFGPHGLEYQDESGALNESFADVMGMGVEDYAYGVTDWVEGGFIFVDGYFEDMRRSLRNPKEFLQGDGSAYPDRFYDPAFFCREPEEYPNGGNDYGGVHTNNMVPSKAAYLTAMGGTFNGCSITGIGIGKQQAIWQRAHVGGYLTTTSGFNAAYNAFRFACNDLFGAGSFECTELIKALQAVELDQGGACSGIPATPPACALASPVPTPTATPSASPSPGATPAPAATPVPGTGPQSDTAMLLISPNGGETFRAGNKVSVMWQIAGVARGRMLTLKWSKDGGAKWKLLKTARNTGRTLWTPKRIHVSDRVQLMVCLPRTKMAPRVCDISDEAFRIVRK